MLEVQVSCVFLPPCTKLLKVFWESEKYFWIQHSLFFAVLDTGFVSLHGFATYFSSRSISPMHFFMQWSIRCLYWNPGIQKGWKKEHIENYTYLPELPLSQALSLVIYFRINWPGYSQCPHLVRNREICKPNNTSSISSSLPLCSS